MKTIEIAETLWRCQDQKRLLHELETTQGNYDGWCIEDLNLATQEFTVTQADLEAPHQDDVTLTFSDVISVVVL